MKKIYCDICGKEINGFIQKHGQSDWKKLILQDAKTNEFGTSFDLCDVCEPFVIEVTEKGILKTLMELLEVLKKPYPNQDCITEIIKKIREKSMIRRE